MNPEESEQVGKQKGGWLARNDYAARRGFGRHPSAHELRREKTLSSWLGEERRADVFASLRPPTERMDQLLDRILQTFEPDHQGLLENLRRSWSELLGKTMAAQVRPADLKDGILILEVNNPSWMYVFERQHKPKIREILLKAGDGAIKDLQFVQRGRFSR